MTNTDTKEQSCLSKQQIEFVPNYLIREIDYRKSDLDFREKFRVCIIVHGNNPVSFYHEFFQNDLIDSRSFNLSLGEKIIGQKIRFDKGELERFQKILRETSQCIYRYACAGHQKKEFVYGNAWYSYDNQKLHLLPQFTVENDLTSLVNTKNKCVPMITQTTKEPRTIFVEAMTNFVNVFNRFDVLICAGATLGIAFWDIFMDISKCFPCILFKGTAESGKSQIMSFLSSCFGSIGNFDHMSGDSTIYAITQEIKNRRNIPVFVDDLHKNNIEKFEPLMKNIYSGISRERGTKNGVEEIPVFTGLVASSNYFFKEATPQILSRILYANMKANDFVLRLYEYYDTKKLEELSQILPLLLQYRNCISKLYPAVKFELEKMFNKNGDRYITNIAISCTMWILVNQIVGFELVDWHKIATEYAEFYVSENEKSEQPADYMLNEIAKMIEHNRLSYGEEYMLTDSFNLRLNIPKFVEKYNLYNSLGYILSPTKFRQLVRDDLRFDCISVPLKNFGRAISINISDMYYLSTKVQMNRDSYIRTEEIPKNVKAQPPITLNDMLNNISPNSKQTVDKLTETTNEKEETNETI